ncbi:putative propionyl-CoA carboxylase beta chain 5 [Anatilimnocola aggregata]|uniref:Putative propionyl-CoA carboxylase beta chain 5 n=1 Tax=Anatilimnocola aggregata TaxID=2528021 RepID=A0A517YMS2_9BACT|nr:acyl-CoA carboxylase subunit beta [Anatilimnocola aggregata]QDU31511.1 putative propionyl-CoA carboxylase beta chain 5 [Anatilimnocola aggregata]
MSLANAASSDPQHLEAQETRLREGGGSAAIERQHSKNRGTARERIAQLLDQASPWLEIGLWAAFEMYADWGGAPAAGVVCGIGQVNGRRHMIIANDATVKAGAFFPMTAKKVLRAQKIAFLNRLPLIYLVDSAGVFLPLQEDVFPDEDDFGRIFRNNAVISAAGIPQYAAILGNCVAGGGYLPVLCDKLLMTEGSGLYLAGPALVKSAIGQDVNSEELGGALMHAAVSGTIDYREKDEPTCLQRLRDLVGLLPADPAIPAPPFGRKPSQEPAQPAETLSAFAAGENRAQSDVRDLLAALVDADSFDEYKADYGQTLVCGTARIGGFPVGIVANQLHRIKTARGEFQFGGVVYVDSAEKAARFVMNCNQDFIPLLFLQDVNGFMVGRDSEREGIIKAGAKLVSAVSNSRSPKLTLITGGSFGAGNYALCGKAFDPRFIFAWPNSRCAVMGAAQATNTLLDVMIASLKKQGHATDGEELDQLRAKVAGDYERQMDVHYAAARLWVDAIIKPSETRDVLIQSLEVVTRHASDEPYRLGVFQV